MDTQPRKKAQNTEQTIQKKLEVVQFDDRVGLINNGLYMNEVGLGTHQYIKSDLSQLTSRKQQQRKRKIHKDVN